MRLLRSVISVRSFCSGGIKAAECVKCLGAFHSSPDTQIFCSGLVDVGACAGYWGRADGCNGQNSLSSLAAAARLLYWYTKLRSLLSTADEQISANKE